MDVIDYMDIDRDFPFPEQLENDQLYAEQLKLRFEALGLLPANQSNERE